MGRGLEMVLGRASLPSIFEPPQLALAAWTNHRQDRRAIGEEGSAGNGAAGVWREQALHMWRLLPQIHLEGLGGLRLGVDAVAGVEVAAVPET
jgi:hypothetical protein